MILGVDTYARLMERFNRLLFFYPIIYLTERIEMTENTDRQGGVEITEEMIKACVFVLQASGRLSFEDDGLDRVLVENLLEAAFSV